MAAPPARARADYDYLIKLLLIGDSGIYLFIFYISTLLFGMLSSVFDRLWLGFLICSFFEVKLPLDHSLILRLLTRLFRSSLSLKFVA